MVFIPSKHDTSLQLSASQYGYMFRSFLDYLQANIFQQKVQSVRAEKYWPEDGPEKIETHNHTKSSDDFMLVLCLEGINL